MMLSLDDIIAYCRRQIYEEVCSNGGMTLTRENSKHVKKSLSYSNFVHSKYHSTGLGLSPGIRGNRSTTNRLYHVQSRLRVRRMRTKHVEENQ
jgi:hypothetical protein